MFNEEFFQLFQTEIGSTVYMVLISSLVSYLIGLPLGVLLVVTDDEGIHPIPLLNKIVGLVINLLRSVPFLIMIVIALPLTRAVVGTTPKSMGASTGQIILKVLIPESKPSLLVGAAISITTILGYSAMAGNLGGGGLGAIAINYGYYRREPVIMWAAVILLMILVQIIQELGLRLAKKSDKRAR